MKGVAVGPYVEPEMVAAIRREAGATPAPDERGGNAGAGAGHLHGGGSDEEEFLEEELEEDFENGEIGSD